METVQEIINLIKLPSKEDVELVSRAFDFAKKHHEGQKRFSGEPYFSHVYQTAKILAELNMSPEVISAGFLHDIIEDAKIKEDIIKNEFDQEIFFLIQGVTKLGKIKYHGVERHKESLRKFFIAVSQDIRVIIIKLADRIHNMKTLKYVPKHKQKRIAKETLEIYVPVAYRLGIRKLSRELEDLAFPFVYPEDCEKTKKIVKDKNQENIDKLKEFEKSIKKTLAKNNIIDFTTSYRLKTFYSIYKKLLRKDWNIEKIYDIAALRIILPEIKDCYNVLGIIHSVWRPLPKRIKDYIAFPKPNGYQSLHTTIFTGYGDIVEIQIKTKKMHQESEYGIASHIFYKENKKPDSTFSWIASLLPINKDNFKVEEKINSSDIPSWIKELVEYQKTKNDLPEELKNDFFEERIFVFTPKGDVIDLPVDSTPIDFAYIIHSEIGNHLSEVKVNGKMVTLNTALKNGDIVEILTKKNSQPNRKWLKYTKTITAKKHIRSAIQNKYK